MNPAQRAYKTRQVDRTVVAPARSMTVAPERFELSSHRLKGEYVEPLTPRSRRTRIRGVRFKRGDMFRFPAVSFLRFSGSPANRTQRNALIRRVWATSPRLPSWQFSRAPRSRTVSIQFVGSCSQGRRAPICTSARMCVHWPIARVGVEPNLVGLKNR